MATARWARDIARTSTDRRAAGSNPTIRTTMANNTVIPRTQHARRLKQLMRMAGNDRSEEHTSELQSLMRNSYAVFRLKKKNKKTQKKQTNTIKKKHPHI